MCRPNTKEEPLPCSSVSHFSHVNTWYSRLKFHCHLDTATRCLTLFAVAVSPLVPPGTQHLCLYLASCTVYWCFAKTRGCITMPTVLSPILLQPCSPLKLKGEGIWGCWFWIEQLVIVVPVVLILELISLSDYPELCALNDYARQRHTLCPLQGWQTLQSGELEHNRMIIPPSSGGGEWPLNITIYVWL